MYIRRTTRKNKDGSTVTYLQLCHNEWDAAAGYSRTQVLRNLGRLDQLDHDGLKRLIESAARFLESASPAQLDLDVDAGEISESRPLGGAYVLDQLWRRLEIDVEIKKLVADRRFGTDIERLLFALVANRALEPQSKLALEEWVAADVAIEGLDDVSSQQLYRAMDFLLEHQAELEKTIFFAVSSILNLEVDLIFFDTTSTYFEIENEDDFRRHGNSKDHRPDRPQVVVGLAVTKEGIPVKLWAWPGNTSDASVVDEVQAELKGWRLGRVLWVVDRGFNGADQKRYLQRGGDHVIVGEKLRGTKVAAEILGRPGRFQKVRDNVEVKEVKVEGTRYIVVRNPQEAERDRHQRDAAVERLTTEIAALNKKKRKGPQHSKAVCALKTHKTLGRYLRELKNGELRIDQAAVAAEAKLDGKYVLMTSEPGLSAAEIALGYKNLQAVERAFRDLKQTLELRPLYHRREDRIRSHIFLCFLALVLVRVAERATDQSWPSQRRALQRMHRVVYRNANGVVARRTATTAAQRTILRALQIPEPPLVLSAEARPS